MLLIALSNGLLGTVCGLWFRIQTIFLLMILAPVEALLSKHTGTWPSAFLSMMAVIFSLEFGYVIGSSAGALWAHYGRRRVLRDFPRHANRGLSHYW
jgi:hypothetical protein